MKKYAEPNNGLLIFQVYLSVKELECQNYRQKNYKLLRRNIEFVPKSDNNSATTKRKRLKKFKIEAVAGKEPRRTEATKSCASGDPEMGFCCTSKHSLKPKLK